MTAQEAIMIIQAIPEKIWNQMDKSEEEAIKIAVEALEKQIPKKAHRNYEKLSWKWCLCGWCLKGYEEGKNYCPNCGQALDWSEEE